MDDMMGDQLLGSLHFSLADVLPQNMRRIAYSTSSQVIQITLRGRDAEGVYGWMADVIAGSKNRLIVVESFHRSLLRGDVFQPSDWTGVGMG
jgi:hypothetical protein